MKLGVRVLALCGLAIIFSQASAQAQYSSRPFGNGNEWYYRSQQAGRGEISKRELYKWMYEDLNPSRPNAGLQPPRVVLPPSTYRPYYYYGAPVVVPTVPTYPYRVLTPSSAPRRK